MRRLIAAAVIILFVIVIAASGKALVSSTKKEVEKMCQNIIQSPSEEEINKFKEYWTERSVGLSFYVNKESIEEIGRAAAKMTSAGKNEDREEILESAEEIKYVIGHIAEQESFCLQSFF